MHDQILQIAWDALSAAVSGRPYTPHELPAPFDVSRGVFVTLEKHGELRGCMGHPLPVRASLAEEVAEVAAMAGMRDPRFPQVREDELPQIDLSVSLMTVPEPTTEDQLDAKRYGVIVTSGYRRGLLLPDLDGVDTPQHQIQICRRKGGIPAAAPVTLERFEVEKIQ